MLAPCCSYRQSQVLFDRSRRESLGGFKFDKIAVMRIAVASDHAGFELKEHVRSQLASDGYEVIDFGVDRQESVDYPLFAKPAAERVAQGEAEFAVLVCGSGVGVAIVANKVPGVRAVNAHSQQEAELARAHNNANVLTLSGRNLTSADADGIVKAFLSADFEGGRHSRRVDQITAIEKENYHE